MPLALADMNPALLPQVPPRFARLRLSGFAALFAAVTVLVVWVSVVMLLKLRQDDAIDAEIRQNTNLARALGEQTVRVLAAVDQATRRLRDAVAAGDEAQIDLVRYANETGLAPKILVQLSLVGPDGHFLRSNLDPDGRKTGQVDLSGREHVRAHLAPQLLPPDAAPLPANGLYIGKPVLGKVSQRWTIQLSRKIVATDGQTLGVVVASLDPGYFEEVYRGVSLGRQGGVTLVGTDRGIRARVIGGVSTGMGGLIGTDSPLLRADAGAQGHYISPSSVDGVERIFGYRQVADYPLHVVVSAAIDEALASWRQTRNVTLILTVLLTLAVGAAATIFVVSVRRLERKNEELQLSEAQAQSASRAKSEFLAAISHELRTPLTSICGFAELMERRLDHPVFREQAGLIRKGAEHLNALLTEILDFARVEAGAMPLNLEEQPLRTLVENTAGFFAVAAAEKGLALDVQIAADVPPTLLCDGLRMKQILNNLLSNAVKFTRVGAVRIEVDRQEGQLRFHVIDTGPGIPPELHELIFEKFRQGDAQVSHQHGGTGLGLALSRALAQLMGGRITLESSVGAGARFTLWLPLGATRA